MSDAEEDGASSASSSSGSGSNSPIVPREILFRLSRGRIGNGAGGSDGGPPLVSASGLADFAVSTERLDKFQSALKTLDDERNASGFDPMPHLATLADALEAETDAFYSLDPDPYDERHPSRIFPTCGLGTLLKLYFKKEQTVQDLFRKYMSETYWRSGGDPARDPFELNSAACRLALDILPGLEPSVIVDSPELVARFFAWAEKGREPLASYATGLLALAMETQSVATDPENRERNGRIIPIMIQRMKELQEATFGGRGAVASTSQGSSGGSRFKRPFAAFAKNKSDGIAYGKRRRSSDDRTSALLNGAAAADEHSNSSWAELEPHIIGHFPIHPLTDVARQVFIVKLLTPLAEYQEFLSHSHDRGFMQMLSAYIDLRRTGEARLAFEATRCLAALFVHKKSVNEWVVSRGGLEALLDVPRPSIAATAVAQCLYFIACDGETMEKVCAAMPRAVLDKLVRYVLWCMQCSHETGRTLALLFFGNACAFRVLLGIIDQQDGLRILYNTISTLKILQVDEDTDLYLSEDQEGAQKQVVRQAMVAFKKYFEAHLILKCDHYAARQQSRELQMQQLNSAATVSPLPRTPRPARPVKLQLTAGATMWDQLNILMGQMRFRDKWGPVEAFAELGGITVCLTVIAAAIDWTFPGRSEMVRGALDTLAICSALPRVQLSFCEKIKLFDDNTAVGMSVILSAAEGEIVQDSAEVRRSALGLINNCVCAPIDRSGLGQSCNVGSGPVSVNGGGGASKTLFPPKEPGSVVRKKAPSKASEELINKIWDCVRANNGIMILLELIHIKSPITDADSLRALACKALVGLARSPAARQIMSKLPIFTNGQLQQLVREPVLLDQRMEHVKFQQHAYKLMTMVSASDDDGPRRLGGGGGGANDFSPEVLHRASVVAQTKIRFSEKQLLQMMQEYLSSRGLSETATVLQREANLPPMASSSSSPSCSSRPALMHQPTSAGGTPKGVQKSCDSRAVHEKAEVPMGVSGGGRITLPSIVSDYLSTQHSLCQNPMTTCPEFDLFVPHKCPDPRPRSSAPMNFATRFTRRSTAAAFGRTPFIGGPLDGRKLDRKLVYSRFRPVRTFRMGDAETEEQASGHFTSCAIMPDDSFVFAGTYQGDVKMFNAVTGVEEGSYACHESTVYHLQPSRSGELLLTSSSWRTPYSGLWSLGEFFDSRMTFLEEEYVEFSRLSQDKVIGTKREIATVYDLHTQQVVTELKSAGSNLYTKNRATFDPTDDLVLNDGVLYDTRAGKEVHKFDKLNQTLSGVFHPNGLEVVSNSEVWDLRTFHLLKTVAGLDQCQVVFSNSGEIAYGIGLEQEDDEGEGKWDSAFKTFDATDYSSIATIETRRSVLGLCSSQYDLQIAVVENAPLSNPMMEESVVRLYDVGRLRADEEDLDGDDGDGNDDDEDDGGLDDEDDDDIFGHDDDGEESDDDDDFIVADGVDTETEAEEEDEGEESANDDHEDEDEEGREGEEEEEEEGNETDGSWEDMESEEVIG